MQRKHEHELVTECNLLKAALKPVMECDPNEDINHTLYEWGLRNSSAVREAQRIMKEGVEDGKKNA